MDSGHVWTLGKENIALYKHTGTELSQPMAALVCDQSLQTCKSSRVPSPQLAPCPLSPCPVPGDVFVLWLCPKAEIHPGSAYLGAQPGHGLYAGYLGPGKHMQSHTHRGGTAGRGLIAPSAGEGDDSRRGIVGAKSAPAGGQLGSGWCSCSSWGIPAADTSRSCTEMDTPMDTLSNHLDLSGCPQNYRTIYALVGDQQSITNCCQPGSHTATAHPEGTAHSTVARASPWQ